VRSASCTWRRGAQISWLSLKTKVDDLSVVWPQNHWDRFFDLGSKLVATVFSGLASKPVAMVSPSLALKPVARVSCFGPQNRQLRFGNLGLKITVTVSWFEPQNQAGFGLSVAPQN
jgi:hypothetical protein